MIRDGFFLINEQSGGGVGAAVSAALRALRPQAHLACLQRDPLRPFLAAAQAAAAPVVVVGGDGTACSILEEIHQAGWDLPLGIIPLGTGNDLARSLGFQPGGLAELAGQVQLLERAEVRQLDRWGLRFPGGLRYWYNYCTFGADARVCHAFDRLRRRHPLWFRTAWMNKAWYGVLGMTALRGSLAANLQGADLGRGLRRFASLIFSNIASYAGGTCLDRAIDPADGLLDVHVLPGGLAQLPYLMQRRGAPQVTRCAGMQLQVLRTAHLQLDGEPVAAPPGRYELFPAGRVPVLAACR